jgi:MFS family permease
MSVRGTLLPHDPLNAHVSGDRVAAADQRSVLQSPAWMQDEGIARETIATSMLVAVLGELAFQVPIGRLSDRFDRRIVLAVLGLGFAGAAVALVLLPHSLPAAQAGGRSASRTTGSAATASCTTCAATAA